MEPHNESIFPVQSQMSGTDRLISDPNQKKSTRLIFLLYWTLILLLLFGAGKYLLGLKKSTIETSDTQKEIVIRNNLIAYTDSLDPNHINSRFLIYDLETKKSRLIFDSLDKSLQLGPWSPSGNLLFVGTYSPVENAPLFLFNNQKNTFNTINDGSDPEIRGGSTTFNFIGRWINEENLFYNSVYSSTNSGQFVNVNINGTVTLENHLKTEKYASTQLAVEIDNKITSLYLNGKKIVTPIVGRVIGLSNKYIVTIEDQKYPNIMELAYDSDFQKKMAQLDENQRNEFYTNLMKPGTESAKLHFCPISEGEEKVVVIKNVWVWGVKIISGTDQVVISQNDIFDVEKYDLVKIYPNENQASEKEVSGVSLYGSPAESFEVSADGNWLVYRGENNSLSNKHFINAKNLQTEETINICEERCGMFRLFNPSQVYSRS